VKNEYIDGQFLAGSCGSQQRQVADWADVVFTDNNVNILLILQLEKCFLILDTNQQTTCLFVA